MEPMYHHEYIRPAYGYGALKLCMVLCMLIK
jgi:hypothetical protein